MSERKSISSQMVMAAGSALGIFVLASAALIVPLRAQQQAASGQPPQDELSCLSNSKQLALALLEYEQDYDERLPNGTQNTPARPSTGVGWAGQTYLYIRNSRRFHCPSDPTRVQKPLYPVSYGLNTNVAEVPEALFINPARTVELFETQNDLILLHQPDEGAAVGTTIFSPAGNGTDGSLRAGRGGSVSKKVLYATGYLGGRVPDNLPGQFTSPTSRDPGGTTIAFLDGHVKLEQPGDVSAGTNAPDSSAPQTGGATGTAAGTGDNSFAATFSLN